MEMDQKVYDVIIIGAGPGGMTAALYAARSELSVLMIERGIPGGQLNNTLDIENYPGYEEITGPDLAMKMHAHVMHFGVELVYNQVTDVQDQGNIKQVICTDHVYSGKTVIIGAGCDHKKLNIPGEDRYSGYGVSYCAVCDGAFFKDKVVAVIGGGDSAIEEAIYLTNFAKEVIVVHRRDELRAQKILQERAFQNDKITFKWSYIPVEICGEEKVQTLKLKSTKDHTEEIELAVEGVFIYVGLLPHSEPFKALGITNEEGWIETDERMMTKVPGIFAIGDIRDTVLRQIVTAVSDGSIASQSAYHYLENLND